MVFCSACGNDAGEEKFCPRCGSRIVSSQSQHSSGLRPYNRRSRLWYLLPILFSIIGGVIAYFVVKDDDPKLAKNCIIVGIIFLLIGIVTIPITGA